MTRHPAGSRPVAGDGDGARMDGPVPISVACDQAQLTALVDDAMVISAPTGSPRSGTATAMMMRKALTVRLD